MAAKVLTALLGLFATAQAGFTLPADLPDGVYSLGLDTAGNQAIEALTVDVSTIVPVHRRELQPRGFPGGSNANCGDRHVPDKDMFAKNGAWDQFYNACAATGQQKFFNKQAVVIRKGNALAYMCNYSKKGNPCDPGEWADAVGLIRGQCKLGKNQVGWYSIPKWNKSYGFDRSDVSFC